MWDFFEQPWTLLGISVLVLFGLLTFRSVCPEKRRAWQLLVPVVIAAAAFGLDLLVTTDLERVRSVVRMAVRAVENEDCTTIARLLASDYQDSVHKGKADVMARCRRELNGPTVVEIKKLSDEVELSGSQAKVALTLRARFEDSSRVAREYKRALIAAVRLYLQKQPDGTWLISRADLLEIDKIPVTWSGV
jgi:hypothetical protein